MTMQRFEFEFQKVLKSLFTKKAFFKEAYGNAIETIDGVSTSESAFMLKKYPDPVVLNDYSKEDNVVFNGGVSGNSRFGDMKEIKYSHVPAKYKCNYAAHEGLDRFTVNANLKEAVADRLIKIAQAKIVKFNEVLAKELIENKSKTIEIETVDDEHLVKLFNDAYVYFQNMETIGMKRAYVTPELYSKLIDLNLNTTAKVSPVNIGDNTLEMFKGFVLTVVPSNYFTDDVQVIFTVDGVGVAYSGIETVRTKEGDQFDGIEIQVAGRFGCIIPEENKQAVVLGTFKSAEEMKELPEI